MWLLAVRTQYSVVKLLPNWGLSLQYIFMTFGIAWVSCNELFAQILHSQHQTLTLHRLNLFSSIEHSWADKLSEIHHSASRLFYLLFTHQPFPLWCPTGYRVRSNKSESMDRSYIYMICASLWAWRDFSLLNNTGSQTFFLYLSELQRREWM